MQRAEMFLEGPGRLIRKVEPCRAPSDGVRSCCKGHIKLLVDPSEAQTVQDSEGNIAMQIDKEGWLYRFQGSPFIWKLVVG